LSLAYTLDNIPGIDQMTFKDALHVIMGEDSSSHYSSSLVDIISHVGAFLTFQKELQPLEVKMKLVKAQKGTQLNNNYKYST